MDAGSISATMRGSLLILPTLRPHRGPGSLQDRQDCRPPDGEPVCDFPACLSELVCLDDLGPQPLRDALPLPWGRHERPRSFNLTNTILHTCQQCVRNESSEGY